MQPPPIYLHHNRDHIDSAASLGFVGALWAWLALYVSSLDISLLRVSTANKALAQSHKGSPSLLPRAAQSAPCPEYRLNRRLKRRLGKPIAPVSQLHLYRHLNNKTLSPTQYLERLTRLSPLGRIRIYRLGLKRQILAWRKAAQSHEQSRGLGGFKTQICHAPLSPD